MFLGYCIDKVFFTIHLQGVKNTGYRRDIVENAQDWEITYDFNKRKKQGGKSYVEFIANSKLGIKTDPHGLSKIFWLEYNLRHPYIVKGYFNPIYLWRHFNDEYSYHGLHGMNFIDEKYKDKRQDISLKYFKRGIKIALERATTVFRDKFKFTFKNEDLLISFYQVEIAEERIAHVTQYDEALTRGRGYNITKFSDQTQTVYLNDFHPLVQCKIYQKTPQMTRVEWTFNKQYASDIAVRYLFKKAFYEEIEKQIEKMKHKINFDDSLIQELTADRYLRSFAKSMKLELVEAKTVLETTHFRSHRGNYNFIRKLKYETRELIEPSDKRGIYNATPWLLALQKQYKEMKELTKIKEVDFDYWLSTLDHDMLEGET